DGHVTGVQTCALPIFLEFNTRSAAGLNSRTRPSASMVMMQSSAVSRMPRYSISSLSLGTVLLLRTLFLDFIRSAAKATLFSRERSEERRVGKECRCRG